MAWAWQIVRYYSVAGVTALFYLAVLAAALLGPWHYMIAILIAQAVTIVGAFPVHRRWVFRSTGPWLPDLVRFLSVWASGAIAGIILTPILVETTPLGPFIAQVIAIVVVSIVSFIAHRFFSFRAKRSPEPGAAPASSSSESHPA